MGEVLKDAYAKERKKRELKDKFGNLCYRSAVLRNLILQYLKELDDVNKQIDKLCDEVSDESK